MNNSQNNTNTVTKLLVISNNLISLNNANGKFIRNYLGSFNNDEIINFYISNDKRSDEDLKNIFQFTDKDAVSHFLKKKKQSVASSDINDNKRNTPAKHILRYLLWNFVPLKKYGLKSWINDNKPTHIITILGNNPFLMKLSYKLSKKLKLPLISFVCEDYPLKKYDFISKNNRHFISYRIFRNMLFRCSKKMINHSSLLIFNTEELRDLYSKNFKKLNSIVKYPISNIEISSEPKIPLDFLYAGNLGLGRSKAISVIASTLSRVSPNSNVIIFSKDANIYKKDLDFPNIKIFNSISNRELMKEYEKPYVLFHAEYDSEYNRKDLKYAFSTKLADLISSKRRILLYSPPTISETTFFQKYLPKNVATNEKELEHVIQYVLSSEYDLKSQNNILHLFNSEINSGIIRKEIEKL